MIAVMGATGHTGRIVSERLLEEGHAVVADFGIARRTGSPAWWRRVPSRRWAKPPTRIT